MASARRGGDGQDGVAEHIPEDPTPRCSTHSPTPPQPHANARRSWAALAAARPRTSKADSESQIRHALPVAERPKSVQSIGEAGVTAVGTVAALRKAIEAAMITPDERASAIHTNGAATRLASWSVRAATQQRAEEIASAVNAQLKNMLGIASPDPQDSAAAAVVMLRPSFQRKGVAKGGGFVSPWLAARGTIEGWPVALYDALTGRGVIAREGATIELTGARTPWLRCRIPRGQYLAFRREARTMHLVVEEAEQPTVWAMLVPIAKERCVTARRIRTARRELARAAEEDGGTLEWAAASTQVRMGDDGENAGAYECMEFEAAPGWAPPFTSIIISEGEGEGTVMLLTPEAREGTTQIRLATVERDETKGDAATQAVSDTRRGRAQKRDGPGEGFPPLYDPAMRAADDGRRGRADGRAPPASSGQAERTGAPAETPGTPSSPQGAAETQGQAQRRGQPHAVTAPSETATVPTDGSGAAAAASSAPNGARPTLIPATATSAAAATAREHRRPQQQRPQRGQPSAPPPPPEGAAAPEDYFELVSELEFLRAWWRNGVRPQNKRREPERGGASAGAFRSMSVDQEAPSVVSTDSDQPQPKLRRGAPPMRDAMAVDETVREPRALPPAPLESPPPPPPPHTRPSVQEAGPTRGHGRFPFYAVARGRRTGIFNCWEEVEEQIRRFPRNRQKGFNSKEEAQQWLDAQK